VFLNTKQIVFVRQNAPAYRQLRPSANTTLRIVCTDKIWRENGRSSDRIFTICVAANASTASVAAACVFAAKFGSVNAALRRPSFPEPAKEP